LIRAAVSGRLSSLIRCLALGWTGSSMSLAGGLREALASLGAAQINQIISHDF
jgi:hypothetical protein